MKELSDSTPLCCPFPRPRSLFSSHPQVRNFSPSFTHRLFLSGCTISRGTKDLLEALVAGGLNTERRYLLVIDGAKALRVAIARVFGERAEVQRCHGGDQPLR